MLVRVEKDLQTNELDKGGLDALLKYCQIYYQLARKWPSVKVVPRWLRDYDGPITQLTEVVATRGLNKS